MVKTEITEAKESKAVEYPILMEDDKGKIVYILNETGNGSGTGVCIRDASNEGFEGNYYEDWDLTDFKMFTSAITLCNM